jgi:peptidoglycan/LPS O-acetylase OafA/YrhL
MTLEKAHPAGSRLAYLDGMRAIAAIYVVEFHAMSMIAPGATGFSKVLQVLFQYGHEAVAIFIVLSGYCLMLPVVRGGVGKLPTSVGTFLKRRAFRILPPYYAALVMSLFLLWAIPPLNAGGTGGMWDRTLPGLEPFAITTHFLLVHNWLPSVAYKINGPHWSVATEFQIYVVYSLVLLPLFRALGPLWLTAVAALVGYAPLAFAPAAAYVAAPWYLALFVFGMWAAVLGSAPEKETDAKRANWLKAAALALVLLCGAFGLGAPRIWFRNRPSTDLLVGASTTLVLLQIGAAVSGVGAFGWLRKLLESRPLVAMGHASYSLYLTHLPILALCLLGLRPFTSSPALLGLLLLGVGTVCSLLVAAGFWYFIERRFMSLPKRPVAEFATRPATLA